MWGRVETEGRGRRMDLQRRYETRVDPFLEAPQTPQCEVLEEVGPVSSPPFLLPLFPFLAPQYGSRGVETYGPCLGVV